MTPPMADAQLRNYGGRIDVKQIDAGHDVMISRPRELAALLKQLSAP